MARNLWLNHALMLGWCIVACLILTSCATVSEPSGSISPASDESGSVDGVDVRLARRSLQPATHGIFLPDNPTPTERTAAGELQSHLRQITGHELPVLAESQRGKRRGFFIGRSATYPIDADVRDALGTDGILLRSHGDDLLLAGNQRGALYAVSVFLEDYLDVRWLAPDCTVLPREGVRRIPEIDRRYVPPARYRGLLYRTARDAPFAMRLRLNGAVHRLDEAHGGNMTYGPWVHTFFRLLPTETYFEEHPEYYALIDGQRRTTQLCLTNADVQRIAIKQVRRWIETHPDATHFSISQNDNQGYCRCADCAVLAEDEGSQAGPLLHFVNAIADAVRDEHPDVVLTTLAYTYTRKPPEHVRPRPNVAVRFCTYEACFTHPLATCPENAAIREDLAGWRAIAPRLRVWDYTINYSHSIAPFPNLYSIKPNIQLFLDHGMESIFEQANQFSLGGAMAALRTYVVARTLWNPTLDTDELIDEFVAGYYGEAAPFMRDYVDLVHEAFRNGAGYHAGIFGLDPLEYMPGDFVPRAQTLFSDALDAVAGDPVLTHRVRLARLPTLYLVLRGAASYAWQDDALVDPDMPAGRDWRGEFEAVAEAASITHIAETRRLAPFLANHPSPPAQVDVAWLRNDAIDLAVVPGFGGRILVMRDRETDTDWIKRHEAQQRIRLMGSGIEAYSQRRYLSPGWKTPFEVTAQDERRTTLTADLDNGLRLERTITLSADAPHIRIESTLRNTTDEPREALLRVHPAFATGDLDQTRLLHWAGGSLHDRPMPPRMAPGFPDGSLWLDDAMRPDGAWALVDDSGVRSVINRIIAGEVDRYYCHVSWQDGWVSLELFSPERELAPGDAISLTYEYELVNDVPPSAAPAQ